MRQTAVMEDRRLSRRTAVSPRNGVISFVRRGRYIVERGEYRSDETVSRGYRCCRLRIPKTALGAICSTRGMQYVSIGRSFRDFGLYTRKCLCVACEMSTCKTVYQERTTRACDNSSARQRRQWNMDARSPLQQNAQSPGAGW